MSDKDPSRTTTAGTGYLQLREFEQRMQEIKDLIEIEIRHERELRDTTAAALAKANYLALKEIERRLGELNHAHAQAMENWARTLPREMFESWQKEYDLWKEAINRLMTAMSPQSGELKAIESRVDAIEGAANKVQGALILLGLMGLAGVTALALGLLRLAGVVQ
jgi:hypothetical protein